MNRLHKINLCIVIFLILFSSSVYANKVLIDPGHGGKDPGAIGVNGLHEKTVNLDISLKLKEELVKRGYEVVLTRETDQFLSLADRVKIKEQQQADLFISIHANAFTNSSVRGTLVLYYDHKYPRWKYPASRAMTALSPQNKYLAQFVLDGLIEKSGTLNKGVIPSSAYMVRHGSMPSILVETAFLSNPSDAALLADKSVRKDIVIGIANGVEKFVSPNGFTDIYGHWAYDSILRIKEQGIILGQNYARYSPEKPLTRAEFLTMMDRLFNFNAPIYHAAESSNDLANEEIVEEIIEEILEEGIEEVIIEEESNTENSNESTTADGLEAETETEIKVNSVVFAPSLPDVAKNHWAYEVLEKAVARGYIQGYPDGSVRPNQAITRAEVSVLFDRIWSNASTQEDALSNIHLFEDVPNDLWFSKAVYRLRNAAILQGKTDRFFVPDRFMSRAEMASMLDRFLLPVNQ